MTNQVVNLQYCAGIYVTHDIMFWILFYHKMKIYNYWVRLEVRKQLLQVAYIIIEVSLGDAAALIDYGLDIVKLISWAGCMWVKLITYAQLWIKIWKLNKWMYSIMKRSGSAFTHPDLWKYIWNNQRYINSINVFGKTPFNFVWLQIYRR